MHTHALSKNKITDLFPGRVAISPQEVGFSVLDQARQTTNNQLCTGRFPLPITVLNGKRMVLIEDIQQFIDKAKQPIRKRRGPRTKAERLATAFQMGGDHV